MQDFTFPIMVGQPMFIIMGKDNCPYCELAVNLMNGHGYTYLYTSNDIPEHVDMVKHYVKTYTNGIEAKTFPQIFHLVDGKMTYVGGSAELANFVVALNEEHDTLDEQLTMEFNEVVNCHEDDLEFEV